MTRRIIIVGANSNAVEIAKAVEAANLDPLVTTIHLDMETRCEIAPWDIEALLDLHIKAEKAEPKKRPAEYLKHDPTKNRKGYHY